MTIRASTSQIYSKVKSDLLDEAKAGAGNNTLVSKSEQAQLSSDLLKRTADALRIANGPGARVNVDALSDAAAVTVKDEFSTVNQASGSGSTTVSMAEVQALIAKDAEIGARVAKAYTFITGRHIAIPSTVPTPPPSTSGIEARVAIAVASAVHNTFGIVTDVETSTTPGFPRVIATGVKGGQDTADIVIPDNSGEGGIARIVLDKQGGDDVIADFSWVKAPTGIDNGIDHATSLALANRLSALGFNEPRVLGGGLVEGAQKTWRLAVASIDANGAHGTKHVQLHGAQIGNAVVVPSTLFERDLAAVAKAAGREAALKMATNIGDVGMAEVFLRQASSSELLDPQDSPFGFDPATEIHYEIGNTLGDMGIFVTFDKQTLAITRVEST